MKQILSKEFNQAVSSSLDFEFQTQDDGLYVIEISASAKSWW